MTDDVSPDELAERLERVETRIDTLSTLVLKMTRESVSDDETGADDPDDVEAVDEDEAVGDSGDGHETSRGYY